MLSNRLAPVPSSKVIYKHASLGVEYAYYVLRSYRNEKGKPTTDVVAIGKKSNLDGYIIPNNNYYLLFRYNEGDKEPIVIKDSVEKLISHNIINKKLGAKKQRLNDFEILSGYTNDAEIPKPSLSHSTEKNHSIERNYANHSTNDGIKDVDIIEETEEEIMDSEKEYGHIFALQKISEKIGLTKILQKAFPEIWNYILVIAMYICTEGNVMKNILQWFEESRITLVDEIYDYTCSEIFSSITFIDKMRFFKEWISTRLETDYLIFDVSSISSYSDNITPLSFGYNRDGENLEQINIGLYYGHSSRLPIFYCDYDGSINDVTNLPFMLEQSSKLGINGATFVLDRGFNSKENLLYMAHNDYYFIIPMLNDRKETKELIDKYSINVRDTKNWISKFKIYGTYIDYKIDDIPVKVFIYFDHIRCQKEESELYDQIDKQEAELSNINKPKRIPNKYNKYFDINSQNKSVDILYEKNYDKIAIEIKRCGYLLYITNKEINNSEQLLTIYKSRDEIEQNFKLFKRQLFFNRLKTQTNKTTDGKLFVGFLALILRTAILHSAKNNKDTAKLSLQDIIEKLKLIKVQTVDGLCSIKLPYSKLQKKIYDAIGVMLTEITLN
jgi:transposase